MRRKVIPLVAFLMTSVSTSAFAQQSIQWDVPSYTKIGNALRASAIPEADINPIIAVLLSQIKTTGVHDQHDSLIRVRTTATEINSSCGRMVGEITPLHGSGQVDIDLTVCYRTPGLHIDSGGISGPRLLYVAPPAPTPVQIAQAPAEQPRPPRHQHPAAQPTAPTPQPAATGSASGGDLTNMSVAQAMAAMGGKAPPPEHLATPRHQAAAPAHVAPTPPPPVAQPAPVAAVSVAAATTSPAPTVTPSATSASPPPPAPAPAQASGISAADRAKFISEVETNHRVPVEIAEEDVDIIAQSAISGVAPPPKTGPKNSTLEIKRVGYILSPNIERSHNWMQFTWTRSMPVENGPAHIVKVSGQMTYIVRTDGRAELSWSLDPGFLQFQTEHVAQMAAEAAARQAAIEAERQRQEEARQAAIAAQQAAAEAQRKTAEAAAEAERKHQEEAAAAALAAKFATIGKPTTPPSPEPAPTTAAPTTPPTPPTTDQAAPPAPPPVEAPPPPTRPPRHKVISDL